MTKKALKRAIGVAALLAASISGAAHADQVSDFEKECANRSKSMHVCVDMMRSPRVVAQSKEVLLANRQTIVHIRVPIGVGLDVRLGGTVGLVDQGISGQDERTETKGAEGRSDGGEESQECQTMSSEVLKYVFPARSAFDGEKSVKLTVTMWHLGDGAETWELPAYEWAQALEHKLIPALEAKIALDDLVVEAKKREVTEAERNLSELKARLDKDARGSSRLQSDAANQLSSLETAFESARIAYLEAVAIRTTHKKSLAMDRQLQDDLAVVVSAAVKLKVKGRDFSDSKFPDGTVEQDGVAEVSAIVAGILGRVEVPRDITLAPHELIYDEGVIGSINVGTSIVVAPRHRSYTTLDVAGDDGSSSQIIETTGGGVDVELVVTYTHYLWAVPKLASSGYFGASAGLSFVDLSADSTPGSIYLGMGGGSKNLGLGVYGVFRKVDELRPDLAVGDSIAAGEEVPMVSGYRPGVALVLTVTPELFTIKR